MSIKAWLSLAGLLALAGCGGPEPPPALVWTAAPGAVHCYETLADADCVPAPLPGERRRWISSGPRVVWTWELRSADGSTIEQGEAR